MQSIVDCIDGTVIRPPHLLRTRPVSQTQISMPMMPQETLHATHNVRLDVWSALTTRVVDRNLSCIASYYRQHPMVGVIRRSYQGFAERCTRAIRDLTFHVRPMHTPLSYPLWQSDITTDRELKTRLSTNACKVWRSRRFTSFQTVRPVETSI
ncbi:hypothetical protein XU18_5083 [Perkinsela sp. CCAP 1560/4]|nr:hypothetical protein XU18_5083 [Perkinsela sp. CCAP 1560/4]|eukprot:KNH02030.1 hypothetical protein XU18_5083 [Perkinsela sp. CCAP 1560/4]